MQADQSPKQTNSVTPAALAPVDYDTLIKLLEHKVRLLLAATAAKLPDNTYLRDLSSEVEAIQAEIKKRLDAIPDRRG